MTNKEAYFSDLDDLKDAIEKLLSLIPDGKTKREQAMKEAAENIAGAARATISCMKNDYIPIEID